jgi:rubredoxin
VPHSARWRCPACGRELGTVVGPTLALEVVPVVVTCPDCRAKRTWTQRHGA